jgi:hypothetical protein
MSTNNRSTISKLGDYEEIKKSERPKGLRKKLERINEAGWY